MTTAAAVSSQEDSIANMSEDGESGAGEFIGANGRLEPDRVYSDQTLWLSAGCRDLLRLNKYAAGGNLVEAFPEEGTGAESYPSRTW